MTDMLAAAPVCPQGHVTAPGAAFCAQCGTPLLADEAPASTGAPATPSPVTAGRASVTLRAAPFTDISESRQLQPVAVFVLAFVGLSAGSLLNAFLSGPRLYTYALGMAVLVPILWCARSLDLRSVGAAAAAAALDLVTGPAVIEPLVFSSRGWTDVPIRWASPLGSFGAVGAACLAAVIVWFCVPRFRADMDRYLRPAPPAVEVSRVIVVIAVGALAAVALGRALTGWVGFETLHSYDDAMYQGRVAQCTSSVDAQFPEFDGTERQNAIDYCVSTG